jgi:tRNA (guanine37-N1)-methyltransferase
MRIDILTLFPEMFDGFLNTSIIKRAREKNLVEINIVNFRDYTDDPHGKVDDTPYGGGAGMVLRVQPIYDAVMDLKDDDTKVILLTPDGITYNEKEAYKLKNNKHLIIICGHYEGFDDRIRNIVDLELSIGDYVLTGGEIPAMAITDSITRLLPGVITEESHINDSFNIETNLLDYPTFTKPREFKGMTVPEVLVNGNHKEIEEYRTRMQIEKTKERRPDLLDN